MIDRIIVLGLARRDQPRWRRRIGGVDQADLGGFVVVNAEQEETPVLSRVQPEEIAWVILFVDDRVSAFRSKGVTQQTARTMLVVEPDIEQSAAVGRPFQRAAGVNDARLHESTGCRLDHIYPVELRPV